MKPTIDGQIAIDVDRLVESRALVMANSGGGKSWLLRRLLEQTYGHVQQIVIDPEDEFYTLRENHDYVLAGRQGGDCPADVRSAAMLARRLLELGVSAVIGIYELKAHERVQFVRFFLESLVNAPKDLWHPVLVVVDEAHIFAPEGKERESTQAVIDLMTRGRKRGFCGVLATQRPAMLHKDASAQANNKLIGRFSQDIDVDRAAKDMGFYKREDQAALRSLRPGEFFITGPALCDDVRRVKVGPVETTHPRAGQRATVAPPPREKVKAVLAKLADLPAEAAAEAQTVADFKRKVAELERQLKAKTPTVTVAAPIIDQAAIDKAFAAGATSVKRELAKEVANFQKHFAVVIANARKAIELIPAELPTMRSLDDIIAQVSIESPKLPAAVQSRPPVPAARPMPSPPPARAASGNSDVKPAQQKILNGLAFLHGIGLAEADKTQLALIVGVSPTSGGYFNNLGSMRSAGLIEYPSGGTVALTGDGQALASTDGVPSTTEDLHRAIAAKLPPAKWKIVEALIAAYPDSLTKDQLAETIGVSATSGGYFNNLGSLRSLGLVDYPIPGHAIAQPVLFLEGR